MLFSVSPLAKHRGKRPASVDRARGRIGKAENGPRFGFRDRLPRSSRLPVGRQAMVRGPFETAAWMGKGARSRTGPGDRQRLHPPRGRRSRDNEPAREDSDWRELNLCLGRFVVAQPFHAPGERLQTACAEQTTRIEGCAALRLGLAALLRAGCLKAKDLLKGA